MAPEPGPQQARPAAPRPADGGEAHLREALSKASREVIEKIAFIKDTIDANGVMMNFSYAGMPFDDVERSLKLFAKKVLPELKQMKTAELVEPSALDMPAHSHAA